MPWSQTLGLLASVCVRCSLATVRHTRPLTTDSRSQTDNHCAANNSTSAHSAAADAGAAAAVMMSDVGIIDCRYTSSMTCID